ncbi:MAG: DnaJ domain-containing protein [Clostridia bacterium]|nr:DnaJ domain-containing protein [Clostridia bacterium]
MDPYKVLGVSPDDSKETIDQAHKNLCKKYHPDRYIDNPLKDLAEEKLKEINEAYEIIKKNHQSGTKSSGNSTYNNSSNSSFLNVRALINQGKIAEAEAILDGASLKNAEWFFLKGLCALKRGWQDRAYTYIQTAVSMDPTNQEYRSYYNQFVARANAYRTYSNKGGYNSHDTLDCCLNLWCLDSCCECMGGDLISCC